MSFRLKNRKQLSRYLIDYGNRVEKALIFNLEYLIAVLVNHAKETGDYEDQTANLRTSIGGVVLKNGVPVTFRGFQGGGKLGGGRGTEFINSLIANAGSGYVIIIVAGMEYATYVENMPGFNVLKKSELKMVKELPLLLKRLKRKIG